MTGIEEAAARLLAATGSAPRPARDPVNTPMIRNWTEALGDRTAYGDLAPPAMIQVWTMPGLRGGRGEDDPLSLMTAALDEAGYSSVVATNCDQIYHRQVKVGEQLFVRARLIGVTGPKRTALGEGWFVTTRSTWYADDGAQGGEPVAQMDFRVLKYRAATAAAAAAPARERPAGAPVMRPPVTRDTEFFWAGTRAGELRVQRCPACSALRHPPGPMCPRCGAVMKEEGEAGGSYVVAAGTGEIYSYVVHHHPPVPGKKTPFVVALAELPEGVRMVGELLGIDGADVRIGMGVRAEFVRIDDELTLPAWRVTEGELPALSIDVTPTFVIASALATRDFTGVHHDRAQAAASGATDIFLNILTTTGLVQRYVAESVPGAEFRAISIRLGAVCQAGDTLTFTGRLDRDTGLVRVTGRCSLGDHVTATVRLQGPR
jgi:uncharacterized protein